LLVETVDGIEVEIPEEGATSMVEVDDECARKGRRKITSECPFALALIKRFGPGIRVKVDKRGGWLMNSRGGIFMSFIVSPRARSAIENYDAGAPFRVGRYLIRHTLE